MGITITKSWLWTTTHFQMAKNVWTVFILLRNWAELIHGSQTCLHDILVKLWKTGMKSNERWGGGRSSVTDAGVWRSLGLFTRPGCSGEWSVSLLPATTTCSCRQAQWLLRIHLNSSVFSRRRESRRQGDEKSWRRLPERKKKTSSFTRHFEKVCFKILKPSWTLWCVIRGASWIQKKILINADVSILLIKQFL